MLLLTAIAFTLPDRGGPVETEFGTLDPHTVWGFCTAERVFIGTVVEVQASYRRGTVRDQPSEGIRTPVVLQVERWLAGPPEQIVVYATPYGIVDGISAHQSYSPRLVQPLPIPDRRYLLAYTPSLNDTPGHDRGMPIAMAAIALDAALPLPSLEELLTIAGRLRAAHCICDSTSADEHR